MAIITGTNGDDPQLNGTSPADESTRSPATTG